MIFEAKEGKEFGGSLVIVENAKNSHRKILKMLPIQGGLKRLRYRSHI